MAYAPQPILSARTEKWIASHGATISIVVALLGGLVGVFDRSLGYHDEIINTDKAMVSVVLDYAMRPVFFALNIGALNLFGNHSYSLVLLSLCSLVLTAFFIYQVCAHYLGGSIALLAVITYAGSPMIRDWGVRAMAHGHAGMFMMASFSCAIASLNTRAATRQRIFGFFAGLLAVLSFSTHPTMAGYLVALCSWAGMTWLLSLSPRMQSNVFARPLRPTLWIAIGVIFGIATLILVYAIWYPEGYLSAWWEFARIPQGAEEDRGYSLFYVGMTLLKGPIASAFLILSLVIAAVVRWTRGPVQGRCGDESGVCFARGMSLYCLVVSLAMVSLNQWRHSRILVSYLPLLVVSFAFYLPHARRGLGRVLSHTWNRRIAGLGAAVIVLGSLSLTAHDLRKSAKTSATRRVAFVSLYEALRNLQDTRIGILANRGPLGTMEAFTEAAGLESERLAPSQDVAMMNASELRRHLEEHRVRYIFWNIEFLSSGEYQTLSARLDAAGVNKFFDWRGLRQLWVVGPSR